MRKTPYVIAISLALTACQPSHPEDASASATDAASDAKAPVQTGMTTPEAAPAPGLSPADAEALGILSAINRFEIDAAQQARDHDLPDDVETFADTMEREHMDNETTIARIGQPRDSEKSEAQNASGQAQLLSLQVHTDDYAQAYVAAMTRGHAETLETLDAVLIPSVTTAAVKTHLLMTRDAVAMHLKMAKSLKP
jgi:putative membrane protein